jgi:hypothetical protein
MGYFFQAITQTTDSRYADRSFFDFLAQAMNVDLNRIVADLFAPLAQTLDQLIFADKPP